MLFKTNPSSDFSRPSLSLFVPLVAHECFEKESKPASLGFIRQGPRAHYIRVLMPLAGRRRHPMDKGLLTRVPLLCSFVVVLAEFEIHRDIFF